MMASNDMQLLEQYAAGHSEEAFSALVSRYINLVYSAALRSVNNPHQAEEITQAVFVLLARKSRVLRRGTILSGWLYQTARLTAANFLRTELRRQHREQQAHMQSTLHQSEPEAWTQVGPLLDDAMAELNEKDRCAIVLRFFENKPLKEVGQALGTSEDAAKMRVNRALDKLRDIFLKRGIALPTAALAAVIAENSIQAAPAGLAAAVAAGVCQGSALTASTLILLKGTMQTMTWIKATAAVGAAAVIALQWQQNMGDKQQLKQLQQQVAQQTEVNRAQQAELEKMKERNTSLARTMDTMTHDVAKARATMSAARSVPPQTGSASPAGFKAGGVLTEMMKDPEMVKAMRSQQAMMVKLQYGALVKQLNLTPDQADKFYQVLIDGTMRSAESGASMLSGGNTADTAKTVADQQKQTLSDLQALLGDAGFAAYKDYQQTVVDRTQLLTMKNYFGDNLSLSDTQEQQLLQSMIAARQSAAGANAPDYSQMNTADKMAMSDQYLQQQEQINQQVLAQAAAYLSPEQLQALGNSQSNLLGMTKASMGMVQKMFGSPSNTTGAQ
jgi:RNA polymerase sigma factor (sigma-70 family)